MRSSYSRPKQECRLVASKVRAVIRRTYSDEHDVRSEEVVDDCCYHEWEEAVPEDRDHHEDGPLYSDQEGVEAH